MCVNAVVIGVRRRIEVGIDDAIKCLVSFNKHEKMGADKAVGIDGVTKEDYGRDLEKNLTDLVERMKRKTYHPTIELNGVSSKLEASLKSVNSEIGNEYPYAGLFSENSQKKLAIQRCFG